ncbi:MAG TPA: hypothetical protein VGQ19_13915 [Burkholderiales bacterium]|jgi:predicted phage tail protein|nr:hypothetical protein [Burkholderiales bacterium]
MYIEGINPKLTYVASLESPIPFGIGTRGMDETGREYVFASITSALTAGDVVQLPLGNSGSAIALTTGGALYNRQVGVVPQTFVAAASGTGFWAQVLGAALVGVRASVASVINTPAYTTATAGALSTTLTASNFVRGITFTTTPTGAGVFAAQINNPTIGTLTDTDNNT